jgi:hypothetical protein
VITLPESAQKLYKDIENYDDQLYAIKGYIELTNMLKDNDEISYHTLKNKELICFDKDLKELLFSRYSKCSNIERRELALLLSKLDLTNQKNLDSNEIQISFDNLNLLKKDIEQLGLNENDIMTKIIFNQTIIAIEKCISVLSDN